ncbi:MAG: methionine gamma-lyase family protein [Bacilli bacterium]|nr:methionine gamma-lyase family protein [Bacilli bacterium]
MLDKNLIEQFNKIDEICDKNSEIILNAFRKYNLSEVHFNSTTGYGYNDIGRDVIEQIYAEVLGAEDSLVRNQFISGSHALTVAYFGLLRPNDTMLSISGLPYDTLHEVIGIKENNSSLKSFGVKYKQIELINDDFDYKKIIETLKNEKIKLITIQRSKGYSTRKSINIEKIKKVCNEIRKVDKDVIIMVDNCYCELVTVETPLHAGADIIVGSLIKNLGGGIAPNGAYIAGKKDLVELCAERLTVPGCGKEVGPSLGINKSFIQGLYFAPSVVASSLKTAILAAYLCEKEGYDVEPKYNEERVDIVQNIIFHDPNKLIKFVQEIQKYSAIDSFATPVPTDMPGYSDQIIMASGSFTQGSSIEISCDGPIRPPYIAYLQGGLTFNYGKIAVTNAIKALKETE